MIKVFLTGSIASGKSTISEVLKNKHNIPVFNFDEECKKLYSDKTVLNEIACGLGPNILSNERVDLKKVAKMVFSDDKKMKILNNILHPRVLKNYDNWLLEQDEDITIAESAIVFEYHLYKLYQDHLICMVFAPTKIRFDRLISNRKMTEEDVRNRMSKQISDLDKMDLSDYIIYNDGNIKLTDQIENFIRFCKNKGSKEIQRKIVTKLLKAASLLKNTKLANYVPLDENQIKYICEENNLTRDELNSFLQEFFIKDVSEIRKNK